MNVQFDYGVDKDGKTRRFYSKSVPDFVKFNTGDNLWSGAFIDSIKVGDLQCEEDKDEEYLDSMPQMGIITDIFHDCTRDDKEYLLILILKEE